MRLEANKIGFRYGQNNWLFRNFSFTVNSGERVGLIAPSGWGKSTLVKLLSGYTELIAGLQPYAGSVPTSAALAGCLFAPRCPLKSAECESAVPPMQELRGGQVRCIHAS